LTARVLSLRDGVRSGITLEQIIEASVLLHDVDDVLDLARPGSIEGAQGHHVLHVGQRRLCAGRATRKLEKH